MSRTFFVKSSIKLDVLAPGVIIPSQVTPKLSYGKIVDTKIDNLESQFKPKSFIIRSLPESMKKKDNKKKQEDMRKKIEEEFDENW